MNKQYSPVVDDDFEPVSEDPGLISRVFNYRTLSSLLRVLGSGVLIASLSILLFRGWDAGTDISRYYTLLAYSGILAVIGFVIGKVVRENKGARTFLALAIGAATVNYTVLGGLMFSLSNDVSTVYPLFANWQASSSFAVLTALASGVLLLTPITYFGFSVFARQSAKRFTILYLISNLALVVPVRSSVFIGVIGLAVVLLILHQLVIARRVDSALATREGHFVIGAQFLPLLVLLGRNVYLYAADEFMLTMGSLIAYMVVRQLAVSLRGAARKVNLSLLEVTQTISALSVALGASALVMANDISSVHVIPLFSVVFAGLLADISLTSPARDANFRRAAAIVLAIGLTVNLFAYPALTTAIASVVAGLLVSIYGYSVEQKSVFVTGLVALLGGLVYQLHDVARLFDIGSWSGLAFVGIVAIVVASLLDRYGLTIRNRALAWHTQFSEWEY